MRIHSRRSQQSAHRFEPKNRINKVITAPELRVISDSGQQLGIMSRQEALDLAEEQELDLVEIVPNAKPPVAKLIQYDKFRYQQKKQEQLQRKNAKKVEVKTIRLSVKIAQNDLNTKARQVDKFLEDGDMVKIELRMRGREQAYASLAEKQVSDFMLLLQQKYKVEIPLKKMGNTFSTTIHPQK